MSDFWPEVIMAGRQSHVHAPCVPYAQDSWMRLPVLQRVGMVIAACHAAERVEGAKTP